MCYVVKWASGNGMHCHCCRSTSEREEEFNTLEDALSFAKEKFRIRDNPTEKERNGDWNDIEDFSIFKKTEELNESGIKELIESKEI